MHLSVMNCQLYEELAGVNELTRKQFLARFDLCMHLDANDDLPTRPSVVFFEWGSDGFGQTSAVQPARCP
jgi:hypothetical protein